MYSFSKAIRIKGTFYSHKGHFVYERRPFTVKYRATMLASGCRFLNTSTHWPLNVIERSRVVGTIPLPASVLLYILFCYLFIYHHIIESVRLVFASLYIGNGNDLRINLNIFPCQNIVLNPKNLKAFLLELQCQIPSNLFLFPDTCKKTKPPKNLET
jgi:hypothetical protein